MRINFGGRLALASVIIAGIVLVASTPSARAQSLGGMNGVISDTSGAVIPNAQVTATNDATGVVSRAVSSSSGEYVITDLIPGVYSVKVDAGGFKTYITDGVHVDFAVKATVNATLSPGTASTTIQVTAPAITLQTSDPEEGTTIQHEVIEELPDQLGGVNGGVGPRGRQIDDFIFLTPGTTGGEFSHQTDGGVTFESEVLFNGIPAVQSETQGFQSNINPPFEMVNQFRMVTSVFSAQYGLAQGAASYNFASGTNQLHGEAFEINRNNYFDARGLEQLTPNGVPQDHENNYGFSIGGPLWLGKLYNGKDRTFWHETTEWYRFNQSLTGAMTVPTSEMKQGDFSQIVNPVTGMPVPIYVPPGFSCNGLTPGTPFPDETIPSNCISSLSKTFLSNLPDPTIPNSSSPALTSNLPLQITNDPARQTSWGFTIDETLTRKQSIHYSQWRDIWEQPECCDNGAYFSESSPLTGLKTEPRLGSGFFLNYTYAMTPNLVMTAGAGWMGELNDEYNLHPGTTFGGVAGETVPPNIDFSSVSGSLMANPNSWGIGQGETSSVNRKLGLAFVNNYLYNHGRHTVNFGFEIRRAFQDNAGCGACGGSFSFNSLTTSNGDTNSNDTLNETNTGNAFASFLLGDVDSAYRQFVEENKLRNFYVAPYVQDNFKATPKLTIDAGIRWDIMVPFTDVHNDVVFLNTSLPDPGAVTPGGTDLLGAATQLGTCSLCAGYNRADLKWDQFSPRIGFAYQINQKTVVRGGYGLVHLNGGAFEFGTDKISANYGSVLAGTYSVASNGTNTPAYGVWDTRTLPIPPATPLTPQLGDGFGILHVFARNDGGAPYTQSYTLGVQRELPWNLFLSVDYVGNRAIHLPAALNNTNQLNPSYLSLGNVLGDAWTSPQGQAALQAAGFGMSGGYYTPYVNFINDWGSGISLSQALLPFPQYAPTEDGNTLNNLDLSGVAEYNSLQVQLQKRFTNGLSFLTTYTLSRLMSNSDTGFSIFQGTALNKYDQSREWAVGSDDQEHLIVTSGVYELPIGTGKLVARGNNFVDKEILGGWQLSGVLQYDSGTPFGIGAAGSPLLTGGNRANDVPGQPVRLNYHNYYTGGLAFNTSGWSNPGLYAVGDAARNQSNLRQPFSSNENVGLGKKFAFGERVTGELRMDYFNLFNRMIVCGSGNFDTTVSDPNFGTFYGPCQGNRPRQGQAYFRMSF
ncbi:MAG TPA: carboxypeptidase-like regulatory domain-containing protein [Acidobacteriaceae bacterium]|nr:carboxypeptidase-like regulatory domain-containing protein [Acidobacteriaceae bacterium]